MSQLTESCKILEGVGHVLADKLALCGIHTVRDLLFHLPFRYQDRTHITPISDLRPHDWAVVVGRVCKIEHKRGARPMFLCHLEDKTGIIVLRFFHLHPQQIKKLEQASYVRAFGEVRFFGNAWEIAHPEYQTLENDTVCPVEETLTPIYSTTQGLSQSRLRQLVTQALHRFQDEIVNLEWMNANTLTTLSFPPINAALNTLHNPPPDTILNQLESGEHPALRRLAFDELIAHRLSMQFARQQRAHHDAPIMPLASMKYSSIIKQFSGNLPFTLTSAQQRVITDIQHDLSLSTPMLRLVQGDVGCGKTVVCALAALQAIANGYQVALMAPTDILSEQHMHTLEPWFSTLGLKVHRLSGKMKTRDRKGVLQALSEHTCHLLIGTHALFQEAVTFASLGLVIIDEQHRFGVEQRLALQQKGHRNNQIPHQLLLTATPIPRTLAMTQFYHLDISIIDELPKGRSPIITAVLNQTKRTDVIDRLHNAITEGRQAYWVCTLIDESETLQCNAATAFSLELQQLLPNARIGLVHGRMSVLEKETIMRAFKAHTLDVLVATTVIEVGVDVPNASVMIIDNAERLGLSQLHQLRGRVGRGTVASHCVLLYQTPLSADSAERLRVIRSTCDGFVIAEKDLQLRGAGEFLGRQQTGYRQYKIAQLPRDQHLLPQITSYADSLLEKTPDTARTIAHRWLGHVDHFLQG